MKSYISHILCAMLLLAAPAAMSQQRGVVFTIQGKVVKLEVAMDSSIARDSVLLSCGFSASELGGIKKGMKSADAWEVVAASDAKLILKRSLSDFDQGNWKPGQIHLDPSKEPMEYANYSLADFGFNAHDIEHIRTTAEGKTRFFLEGFSNAREVYLSGNFVNWSTLSLPMKPVEGGWQVDIDLKPGVWGYKFVVDGTWHLDPLNPESYHDGQGHLNTRYVKTNHLFTLPGHLDASKVILSGSFNGWPDNGPSMRKSAQGWELPVYLAEGTYTYKYVIRNKGWNEQPNWILDPLNPNQRSDEWGNMNSVVSLGEKTEFYLEGFQDAEEVFLSGSFVGWSQRELPMYRRDGGWYRPYVLAPGNYEYKFVVDGTWMIDPMNPVTTQPTYRGEGEDGFAPFSLDQVPEYTNSVWIIEPNHRFALDGYEHAEHVSVSGSFNGWANPGYSMIKTESGWELEVHLPPGKTTYKFIVDGDWIHDPANSQKERNEFNEFNSVVWKQ